MPADSAKVLGQLNPDAAALTAIYTVPSGKSARNVTFTVCNRSSVATSFRVSIAVGGDADHVKQYIFYDNAITGNETVAADIDATLNGGDEVRVYATLATLTFTVFGVEQNW